MSVAEASITQSSHRLALRVYTQGGAVYEGAAIDGDIVELSCSNSIGVDAAGTWYATLTSRQLAPGTRWDAYIMGGDYVEILLADTNRRYSSTRVSPPIVMRGFVDSAEEVKGVDGSGRPQQQVRLTGRNFGSLAADTHFFLGYEVNPLAATDNKYYVINGFGTDFQPKYPIPDFVQKIITATVEEALIFRRSKIAVIPQLTVSVDDKLSHFQTFTATLFGDTGSAWQTLQMFQSLPFGEMFFREGVSGPEFVFRFAPYKSYRGGLASVYATDPGTIAGRISWQNLITYARSRSLNDMSNIGFVYPNLSMVSEAFTKAIGIQQGVNPWVDIDSVYAYGPRRIEVATNWLGIQQGLDVTDGSFDSAYQGAMGDAAGLASYLQGAYSQNHLMYSGQAVIPGDERVQPGMYYAFPDGLEYYVNGVTHSAGVQGGSFTSTLSLMRGQ